MNLWPVNASYILLILFYELVDRKTGPHHALRRALFSIVKDRSILPKTMLIAPSSITEQIIETAGGMAIISKAKINNTAVALKRLKSFARSDKDDYKDAYQVQLIMAYWFYSHTFFQQLCSEAILWRQLNHKNILSFLGICKMDPHTIMVSPWMPHGNLREFLSKNQGLVVDRLDLVSSSCICFLASASL